MAKPRSILKFLLMIVFLAGFSSAISMRVQGSDGAPSEQWQELLRTHRLNFPTRLCMEWQKLPENLKAQKTWNLANECDPKNSMRSWLSATVLDPETVPKSRFKVDPLVRLGDLSANWTIELGANLPELGKLDDVSVEAAKRMIQLSNDQIAAALLRRKLASLGFETLNRLVTTIDCAQDKANWAALRLSFEELSWIEARQVLDLATQKGCFTP